MTPSRPSTPLDLALAALLAVLSVVFAIYVPLGWGAPAMQDLVPAEGRLVRTSTVQTVPGGRRRVVIRIEGQPLRFSNDALRGLHADRLRGAEGRRVRVLYPAKRRNGPVDVVKSYGLWVDGVEIASAARALQLDRFASYVLLPLLGAGMSCFGLWRFLVIRSELQARGSRLFPLRGR